MFFALSAHDTIAQNLSSSSSSSSVFISQPHFGMAEGSELPFAVKNRGMTLRGACVLPVKYLPRVTTVPDRVARDGPQPAQGGADDRLNDQKSKKEQLEEALNQKRSC